MASFTHETNLRPLIDRDERTQPNLHLKIDKETNIKYNVVYGIDAPLTLFKPTKDAGNVGMVTEILLGKLHIRSRFWKLIAGSILTALMISLGMVGILKLMGISIDPGVPAAVATIGAAAYAARCKKERQR